MEDLIVLEWSYTPSDYLEEEIHSIRDGYSMIIAKGKIEARIKPGIYDPDHKMRDQLAVLKDSLGAVEERRNVREVILDAIVIAKWCPEMKEDVLGISRSFEKEAMPRRQCGYARIRTGSDWE